MPSLLLQDEDEKQKVSAPSRHALSFFVHGVVALASWVDLMLVGYALNPPNVSQNMILLLSFAVPLLVGIVANRFRQSEMAPLVWLLGLIWFMIVALWIVDMPTAPYQCLHCDLTEKLLRTFFSIPGPSGLIDDDGPFVGTWPAAALIGYAIGARLALRRSAKT